MHNQERMRIVLFTGFLLSVTSLAAQKNITPANHLTVEGKVKHKIDFSLDKINTFAIKTVDSVIIFNHLMQRKNVVKNMKGILLKDILHKTGIDAGNPKVLSEFYIECIAADHYKSVFSWNGIFNTETGNNVFVITEKDNKKTEAQDDGISIISTTGKATGRRYLTGIEKD